MKIKGIICLYLLVLIGGCGNHEKNQVISTKEPVIVLKEDKILEF